MEKPLNITSFVQRPVDSFKEPVRSPITEWEYDEIHAGERPHTGNTSSSSSGLYEFSIGSEEESDRENKDDLMSLCHPVSYNEPDLMKLDPNQVGRALQNDLDFVASSHFENEEKIQRQKETTKSVMATFKYTYFDDDVEDPKDRLPKIKRKKSPNNSSSSKNIFSGSSKHHHSSINGSSTIKSVTDMLKSSTTLYGVPEKTDIERRTSQLREKKSPKVSTVTDSGVNFSEDSDIDILKSSCSTLKNSKQPFKKEICETTSQFREERKPKQKEPPSDEEYYLDKKDKTYSHMNTLDADEFQISDESDFEESLQNDIHSTADFMKSRSMNQSSKLSSFNPNLNTSELLKPIDSFETADITKEQYDQLNKSIKTEKKDSTENQDEGSRKNTTSMMKVTVLSTNSSTNRPKKQVTINTNESNISNKPDNNSKLQNKKETSYSQLNDSINSFAQNELPDISDLENTNKSTHLEKSNIDTNKTNNSDQSKLLNKTDNLEKSNNKSQILNKSMDQSNSKYESNPPSMFSKYIEENPPPPKVKDETPTKFKYDAKPLVNNPPSMYANNPPKPPNKVQFEQSTRIEHNYFEVPDNPPSFLTETDRNKKKRKPAVFYKDPLKEFELDDEEKVLAEHKRKKMIEERVNGPSNTAPPKKNTNSEKLNKKNVSSEKADPRRNTDKKALLASQRSQQMKEKEEKAKKMFYEPAETQATRLRNQRIKQKLAIKHEQERILDEAENDRIRRQQQAALQIEPELLRLEQISKERQNKERRFTGRGNNKKTVESIKNAINNAKNEEVLLRRNDRSLILQDVQNKINKERRRIEQMNEYRVPNMRQTKKKT